MKLRLHSSDGTDYIYYEGETVDEISEQSKERMKLPTWKDGWSEILEE